MTQLRNSVRRSPAEPGGRITDTRRLGLAHWSHRAEAEVSQGREVVTPPTHQRRRGVLDDLAHASYARAAVRGSSPRVFASTEVPEVGRVDPSIDLLPPAPVPGLELSTER